MAVMDNNRIAWTYTDDNGTDWRVSAKKSMTDQQVGGQPIQGGSAALASVPRIPQYIKMRKRWVVANGVRRAIVVYKVNADAWLAEPTAPSINIDLNGASVAATFSNKKTGEKMRDTTSQSA